MTGDREVLATAHRWVSQTGVVALATVIETRHSTPRAVGATMAIAPDGSIVGSVSAGCVEAAVVMQARAVLDTGLPQRLVFGTPEQDEAAIGLTCGGQVHVFVERIDVRAREALHRVARAVASAEPVAVATVIGGSAQLGAKVVTTEGGVVGTMGTEALDRAVTDDARAMLATGATAQRRYRRYGERDSDSVAVFIQSYAPPPRLYIFGAGDFAEALSRVGKLLGFHVTVCDARATFAARERFPEADEVVVQWPHRLLETAEVDARSVICVLTHDAKFDVPVLMTALRSPAGYIGAMGSRRTHEDRMQRLRAAGVRKSELERVRSPIGLDLGGRTPEETAIAIAAEWIQLRCGGSGRPLSHTAGPIHVDGASHGAPR